MKKTSQRGVYDSEVIRAKCFSITESERNHLEHLSDLAKLSEKPGVTRKHIYDFLMKYHDVKSTTSCIDTNVI